MEKQDDFYIGYVAAMGAKTKKTIKLFVVTGLLVLLTGAFLFAFFQRPAVNSSYDFGNPTKVVGVYHAWPYPMLRVKIAPNQYKEIVLLGFGKMGAKATLAMVATAKGQLNGKELAIEGQLVYYNGKTFLEVDDSQKVTLIGEGTLETATALGSKTIEGEVVDPKCYFGVMKPGYGKIHKSCAALCILGGMPPVLVYKDEQGKENYFLLTDAKGQPLHQKILPYVGQPSRFKGAAMAIGNWQILKIDPATIEAIDRGSAIY